MPELPELEHFKQYIDSTSLHQKITGIHLDRAKKILENIRGKDLESLLKGEEFSETFRYGKYLFIHAGKKGWLGLHFGMTGELKYYKEPESKPDYARLTIDFENNYHLAFINTRLLGKIYWLKEPRDFIQKKDLGPDADRMQKKTFLKKLDEKNGMIKSALMDQSFMAGIGNEYSDEILYQTKIYPRKKISGLSGEERERIFDTMQKVLEKAVEVGADHSKLPHSYLLSHRKKGGKCPEHDVKLKRIRAGGRRGYYCPVCQKKSD